MNFMLERKRSYICLYRVFRTLMWHLWPRPRPRPHSSVASLTLTSVVYTRKFLSLMRPGNGSEPILELTVHREAETHPGW